METKAAVPARNGTARHATEVTLQPGRTVVHDRVVLKVVEQLCATALQVDRGSVTAKVSSTRGQMTVTVASPLSIPPLDDDTAVHAAGSIVDRLSATQTSLRERIGRVTGREVARVNITISGAILSKARRVQ
jgi:hypothetical protein